MPNPIMLGANLYGVYKAHISDYNVNPITSPTIVVSNTIMLGTETTHMTTNIFVVVTCPIMVGIKSTMMGTIPVIVDTTPL